MAVDSGLRVLAEQHTQELQQGSFLCVGAGVFGFAVSGQPADVAHAYAVAVVSRAVCACLVLGATTLDSAVEVDDIVVADPLEATPAVPTVDVGGVVVRSLTSGGAVDDDFGDGVHSQSFSVMMYQINKPITPTISAGAAMICRVICRALRMDGVIVRGHCRWC